MSKELVELKNDCIAKAEELLAKAKVETRALTDAEVEQMNGFKAEAARIDATLALEKEFAGVEKREVKKEDGDVERREAESFENFIRGRIIHERAGEMEKGNNGDVIPKTIARRIIKKVYDVCPILAKSAQYNAKGTLSIPFYPAVANTVITVAYKDEFSDLTSSTGNFDSVDLTGFLAGALTKISRSLINNAEFDIVGFVVDEMAESIKRFIEKELINGTSGKVTGLSTLTNIVTAASATAITSDEVIKVHDKVKDEYQANAMWIMSSATRTALRLLKDNTGRYLLNDDVTSPFGTSLLGKPVYVSDNMPNIATGKTTIYYGDFKGLATKFSENIDVQVLREHFATQHAVGVVGWLEFDGKVVNEQMLAGLTQA